MKKTDSMREHANKNTNNAQKKEHTPQSTNELLHELQVNQEELELQNEQLKQSQEELSNLYHKYYNLYDEVPVGYFTLDKDGIIRELNAKGAEMLQVRKEMIIGRGFSHFIPKDNQDKYFTALNRASATGDNQNLEIQLKRGNKLFYAQIEIISHIMRNVPGYRVILNDITERKHAEEELKEVHEQLEETVKERTKELEEAYHALSESEEKFREIFNQANDMITLVELGENGMPGQFLDVNDVAPKRLGYSKEEFSKISTVDIIDPEYRPQMAENAKNLMKNGQARFEIVNIDKWGTKIPVEVSVHLFKLRGKDVILAISHDIRERKQAEKQLNKLLGDLKRSNEELQQFAYVTSHDLQEPLRTIASFTQLLERRYKGQFDSDADEFMEYIVDASVRMKRMITDLLEYSRIDTQGKEFEEYNSERSLNRALKHLQSSIEEYHAEVTNDQLPVIVADKTQITRVFQNLISNAIKFHKEGIKPKIHVSSRKEGNEYVFSVQDNGIGIEKQYKDHIFQVFKRLHTMSEYKGTGIGLAIIKKTIDRHGGRLWVESEFGKGSTFYFTIPIKNVV